MLDEINVGYINILDEWEIQVLLKMFARYIASHSSSTLYFSRLQQLNACKLRFSYNMSNVREF